ncbi:MAG: hypothetical protein GEU86_11100 [Actinophytocola sp.]|nr:hypothetical protein [Actinophytocola sp.]
MADNARDAEDSRESEPLAGGEGFGLEAYLERQHAEFANGPTMAELLARADRRRACGMGVSRDSIVRIQRELRDEGERV